MRFLLFLASMLFGITYLMGQPVSPPAAPLKGGWMILNTKGAPEARHENAFVESGGKFYLIGGRGLKPVNVFDPEQQVWTYGPLPPLEMHHFQAFTYQGNIYVMGALTGNYPHEKPIDRMYIFDPVNEIWTEGPHLPEDRLRGAAGAVVVDDKAYLVSGIVDGHYDGHVPWMDVYDFKSGTWTQLADAPRPRDHFQAVAAGGKIYCIAGRNSSAKTKETMSLTIPEVDVYDISTDSWSTLPESQNLPTQRAGNTALVHQGEIYVLGGESAAQKEAHADLEVFIIDKGAWKNYAPLREGRHGTQAIRYGNAIYIAAGSGNRGGGPELNSIEKFPLR